MGRVLHESKKLTMGRRKIEIKKIQKKTSLQVTFTKRRTGLFKKAGELSVLCGSDVSIIVRSPANKVYAFGTPSVERVLHRYEMGASFVADDHHCTGLGDDAAKRREYEKAVRTLQEKKMETIRELMGHEIDENGFWWDQQIIEGIMEVLELEEYLGSLEDLRNKVLCRIEEIMEIKEKQLPPTYSSPSSVSVVTNQGSMEESDAFGTGLQYVQNTFDHIDHNQELQKLMEVNIGDAADDHHAQMKLEDDGELGYSNLGSMNTSTYNLDFDNELFCKLNYGNSITTFNDVEAFLGGF